MAWLLLPRALGVVDFACWVNFSPMAPMGLGYGWMWISGVFGFVDNTHPAPAQLLQDAIVRDGLADEL